MTDILNDNDYDNLTNKIDVEGYIIAGCTHGGYEMDDSLPPGELPWHGYWEGTEAGNDGPIDRMTC